ncbi:MAG: cohesin domain-containing protein [Phycisphaerales bacterium]
MQKVVLFLVLVVSSAIAHAQPDVVVRFNPEQSFGEIGDEVTVQVVADVSAASELVGFGFDLCFDPLILQHDAAVQVDVGVAFVPISSADGDGLAGVILPTDMPVSGQTVVLAEVTFTAIAEGASSLDILTTPGDLLEGFFGVGGAELDSEFVAGLVLIGPAGGTAIWDNGPADGVTGFVSTINDHTQSVVADDCWLNEGMFYSLDTAYVRMAITAGFVPQTELWFFADCDGEPDGVAPMFVVPQASFEVVDASPPDPLLGTVVYEICFELDRFIAGEDIRWVSAVHTGQGVGFWVSANDGTVQGKQAHANAAGFDLPAWTPADQDICCGVCTDVFFRIEGKCCWRVLAQSNFDLDGLSSPVLAQNAPWNRSFDDFQLADPCKQVEEWGICRIEAIFATNCDLSTIYGEIFDSACDTVENPLAARARLEPTSVELIGSPLPSGSDTLPIYRVIFDCPPDLLPTGRNYWFSIYSEQGFVAGKRSVWLFQEQAACDIRLNEALYHNPPIGFTEPTPVSDAGLAGAARGHAFSVWVCDR